MTQDDLRELTKHMQYVEVDREESSTITKEGDLCQNYYVILRGCVQAVAKNYCIFQYAWVKKAQKSLLLWKKHFFDVRVNEAMKEYLEEIEESVSPEIFEKHMNASSCFDINQSNFSPINTIRLHKQHSMQEPMTAHPSFHSKVKTDLMQNLRLSIQN